MTRPLNPRASWLRMLQVVRFGHDLRVRREQHPRVRFTMREQRAIRQMHKGWRK